MLNKINKLIYASKDENSDVQNKLISIAKKLKNNILKIESNTTFILKEKIINVLEEILINFHLNSVFINCSFLLLIRVYPCKRFFYKIMRINKMTQMNIKIIIILF